MSHDPPDPSTVSSVQIFRLLLDAMKTAHIERQVKRAFDPVELGHIAHAQIGATPAFFVCVLRSGWRAAQNQCLSPSIHFEPA